MIFVGDVAIPPGVSFEIDVPSNLFKSPLVANLEGPVCGTLGGSRALVNGDQAVDLLGSLQCRAVSLANNHIFDLGNQLAATNRALAGAGIVGFGAGESIAEASAPVRLKDGSTNVWLMGFGWSTIECRTATQNSFGVNPLRTQWTLDQIRKFRRVNPHDKLVAFMHWNYELELYPQPGHRQLAFAMVDEGVDLVVGCHSHCVQGVEVYKGRPIVYGLGNWLVPAGEFWNGRLRYPPISSRELAVEWEPVTGQTTCHFFSYSPKPHRLTYDSSFQLGASAEVADVTPFAGFSHRDYVAWFRKNRRKRKLLPIYRSAHDGFGNALRDLFVAGRGAAITAALRAGVKGMPS